MMRQILFALLLLSVVVSADNAIPGKAYPYEGCSVAAGTVQQSPSDYGDIAIANIVLKNDQPLLPLPQNLCTAFKAYLVVSADGAKKLGLTGDAPSQEFDVEFWFRDIKSGSFSKPFALTSVKLHKLRDKTATTPASEYRHHGGAQYTWDYGGYTLVFAAPQALYPLGLKKDGSYKVVVILKKKGEEKPLFCRYWWHGQADANSPAAGVFTISENDVETIYATYAGFKGTGRVPTEISAAKAAYDALVSISPPTGPAFEKAAKLYVDAYIRALLYEFDHGASFKQLSDDQRKDDRAVITSEDFKKALLESILAQTTPTTSTTTAPGTPTLSAKDRLVALLEHYSKVLRVSVEFRKGFIESVKLKDDVNKQDYDGAWNKFQATFLTGLTRLGDNLAAQHFDQPYEVLDNQFPRQVIRPEDKLYNTLAEQYTQEQERLTAVTFLLNLVRSDVIKPEDLPTVGELGKLSSNGLDRSTQRLATIKASAPGGSVAAKFFEDRTSKRQTKVTERNTNWLPFTDGFGKASREEVAEFGTFLPYAALIQKDIRQDRKLQALLKAAETGAQPDLDNYEALSVGRATGIGGSRVGGYLRGDVLNDEAKAESDSNAVIGSGGYWYAFWKPEIFRSWSSGFNLAMAIPLSAAFKAAGGVFSAVFAKSALLRIGAVAAEKFVATLGPVFEKATVAIKAAVPGLEKGGQYVVEKLTEEGGKKFVYLTQAGKTGQPVKMAAEEFEAALRSGAADVTLSEAGSEAFKALAKASPELVERGSFVVRSGGKVAWGQTAKQILNVETVSLKTQGPGLFARLTTGAFDRAAKAIGKSGLSPSFKQGMMKFLDKVLLAPSRPIRLSDVKGLWGKISNIRFTSILRRNPASLASELEPGTAAVIESNGQKFLLEAAPAAGVRPGSDLAWQNFVAGSADAADLNILVGQRLTVGSKGLVPGELWEITGVGADGLPQYTIVSAGPKGGPSALARVGRKGSLLQSQVRAQDLSLATATAPGISPAVPVVSSEVSSAWASVAAGQGDAVALGTVLKGQRLLVTQGPRAGTIYEITGAPRGSNKIWYRVVQSDKVAVGTSGPLSSEGIAQEGLRLQGTGSAAVVSGVSAEISAAWSFLTAGTGDIQAIGAVLKGQRVLVTTGPRAGSILEITGVPKGSSTLWYKQIKSVVNGQANPQGLGALGPFSKEGFASEGWTLEGATVSSVPVVAGVSSEVSSAWSSFVAGSGDVNALGAVLTGQRIVVTQGPRTGVVYEITGVPTGGRQIWYRVVKSGPNQVGVGTSGPLSAEGIAQEGLQLEGAVALAPIAGIASEASTVLQAFGSGTYSGSIAQLESLLKGQRLVVTQGSRAGTVYEVTGIPTGGKDIWYRLVKRAGTAPELGTSGPLSAKTVAEEGLQIEGTAAAPVAGGVASDVQAAWSALVAGKGSIAGLSDAQLALLKGQRLVVTTGSRAGSIYRITGVPKGAKSVFYEVEVPKGTAPVKGTSGPLSSQTIADEGLELEGAGGGVAGGSEPVFIARPIKDYVGFQTALGAAGTHGTAPVAAAVVGQFLGPATSIPASSVTRIAVAYLPTYKWAQIAVLGLLTPQTKDLIVPQPLPVGPDLPKFEYTSIQQVTTQVDRLCYGLDKQSADNPDGGSKPAPVDGDKKQDVDLAAGLSALKRCEVSADKKEVSCLLADKTEFRCSEWLKNGYGVCLSEIRESSARLFVSGPKGKCVKQMNRDRNTYVGDRYVNFGDGMGQAFNDLKECGADQGDEFGNAKWSFTAAGVKDVAGMGKAVMVTLKQSDDVDAGASGKPAAELAVETPVCRPGSEGKPDAPGITCNLKPWATGQRCTDKSKAGHFVCADWTDASGNAVIMPSEPVGCYTGRTEWDSDAITFATTGNGMNYAECPSQGSSSTWGYSNNKLVKPGVVEVTICDQAGQC